MLEKPQAEKAQTEMQVTQCKCWDTMPSASLSLLPQSLVVQRSWHFRIFMFCNSDNLCDVFYFILLAANKAQLARSRSRGGPAMFGSEPNHLECRTVAQLSWQTLWSPLLLVILFRCTLLPIFSNFARRLELRHSVWVHNCRLLLTAITSFAKHILSHCELYA